ncbi:MAG: CGLD27 family protein [Synechococcales bacterium]|nr:CGLD27 family protein [Synechococcales bacterium]
MQSPIPCPVPMEQRPVNEFRELSESWFFKWATVQGWSFIKPLAIACCMSAFVSVPVAAASFPFHKYPLQCILVSSAGACLIPFLLLVRLYLGWNYVRSRLLDTKIFYEESGWYDGQIWEKTPDFLDQDRLIVTYEVQPILNRLQQVLVFAGGIWLGLTMASLGWGLMGA